MKRVGLVLAIILLASLFEGCVSDVTTKPAETPSNQPAETHTKEPRGSYSNPASVGEVVVVRTFSGTFEIAVTDFVKGEEAYQIVKAGNMFNPKPGDGYGYLLVKVRFRYESGKTSHYVSPYNFKAYSNGAGYSPAFVIFPDNYPEFKDVNLMPGGEIEGWIAFIVPEDKNVLIAYEYMFEPVCFIKV